MDKASERQWTLRSDRPMKHATFLQYKRSVLCDSLVMTSRPMYGVDYRPTLGASSTDQRLTMVCFAE